MLRVHCMCRVQPDRHLQVYRWECGTCQPHSLFSSTVAALALPALMALITRTLASFIRPDQLFVTCTVWSCGINMSSAHCSAPHVPALALQALMATHAHPLIFKVENHNLKPPKFLVANKTIKYMDLDKTQVASQKLTCQKPGCTCFNFNQ